MSDKLKAFFLSNWTFSEKSLLLADVLLLGILIGWVTSPIKKRFSIVSGNCKKYATIHDLDDEEKEEE